MKSLGVPPLVLSVLSLILSNDLRPVRASTSQDDSMRHGELKEYQARDNLSTDLLREHNSIVPGSEWVVVEVGLSLGYIIELDYTNQILTTSSRMNMKWRDPRLSWNTSDYGGIKRISFPPHRIWRPMVYLKNSADEQWDPTFPIPIAVTNEGQTFYDPPGIFKCSCVIDATHFPFDHQTCHFRFGLMQDEGIRMDVVPLTVDPKSILRNYSRHAPWDIVNITVFRLHNDLTFSFTLRRRPLFYLWTLVIPVLLMSYALPLLLLIPMHSRERLICVFVFFELLPELLRYFVPQHIVAGVSDMGRYALLVNALGFIVLLESVLQAAFHSHRRTGQEQDHGSKSSDRALIRDDPHPARGPMLPKSPSAPDVVLMLTCYTVLTSWNLYTFFTLPWYHDTRPHF